MSLKTVVYISYLIKTSHNLFHNAVIVNLWKGDIPDGIVSRYAVLVGKMINEQQAKERKTLEMTYNFWGCFWMLWAHMLW